MSTVEMFVKNSKSDDYHVGRLVFDAFSQKSPDSVCQIDAWTGKKETYGSQLQRSVKLARCFRRQGLKPGDVLALGGSNHLDINIPFYAALFNGLPIVGVDPYYKYDEIKKLFKLTRPKIAFCQQDMLQTYQSVAQDLGLDTNIVCFDEGKWSWTKMMLDGDDSGNIEDFQCSTFDLNSVYAWLIPTSGTTGGLKVAAFQHKLVVEEFISYMQTQPPNEKPLICLSISPVQWISSYINAIAGPLMNYVKLMSSGPDSVEHFIDIINEYRPSFFTASPSLLSSILKNDKKCDLRCFFMVFLTGSKIYKELFEEVKSRIHPYGKVMEMYGQTETLGAVMIPNPGGPVGSCGIPMPKRQIKLVDPDTGEEVTEPNVPGELWTKGPSFTKYYNDPKATAEAFTEDGWYKTGDLLQKDDKNNYYYVDRLKTLIKYQGNTIIPQEMEEVIMTLDGVHEVAVTSIPDPTDCELTVACVVRGPGSKVTAGQVKDIVASKLSVKKQLHGGVVFMDALPKTSTGKVHRHKLKEIVLTADRL